MNEAGGRRAYDSTGRQQAAIQRRRDILAVAGRLFLDKGYAATTMAEIATAAGVNVDTLYAGLGTKADLFALLIETELAATAEAMPEQRRNYLEAVSTEPDGGRKLDIYAEAVTEIWQRMAPLLAVLQSGAAADVTLAEIWDSFIRRRADNLALLVESLEGAAALRDTLDRAAAADAAWAISSTEVYMLLTAGCGWRPQQYRDWLADTFRRTLLREP
jgi:AcrR family transcriptional regulator